MTAAPRSVFVVGLMPVIRVFELALCCNTGASGPDAEAGPRHQDPASSHT